METVRVPGMADVSEGGSDAGLGEGRRLFRHSSKFRWPIVVQQAADGQSTAPSTLATTFGVSVGGAFVATDELLSVGTWVNIWLHPPAVTADLPPVLRLRAEVRWAHTRAEPGQPMGYGIRFCAITTADEMALHTYFSHAHKVVP